MPHPSDRPSRWSLILALLLGTLAIAGYYHHALEDGDLWWHMAYGRTVLETGSLTVDHTQFSWTDTSGEWVYVSWLGDVILYLTHRLGGGTALTIMQIVLYLGLVSLFLRLLDRRWRRPSVATLLVILLAFLVMKTSAVMAKNSMFSIVFYAVLFWIYQTARASQPRLVWLLPPLLAVWVNVHGEVLISLAIVGALVGGELLLAILRVRGPWSGRARLEFVIAAVLCLGAIMVTPEGYRLPLGWIKALTASQSLPGTGLIADKIPTYTRLIPDNLVRIPWAVTVWIWALLSLVYLGHLATVLRQRDWSELPLVAVAGVCITMSWMMGRLIPVGVIAWLFVTGRWLLQLPLAASPRLQPIALGMMAVLALGSTVTHYCIYPDGTWKLDRFEGVHPVAAADFTREYELPDPIFNDYLSGAYLLWALAPERKIAMDPRYTIYEPSFRAAYMAFEQKPTVEELDAFTAKSGMKTAILQHRAWRARIGKVFQESAQWRLVFVGPVAAVYVQVDAVPPQLARAKLPVIATDRIAETHNVISLDGALQSLANTDAVAVVDLHEVFLRNVPRSMILRARFEQKFDDYLKQRAFEFGETGGQWLDRQNVRRRFAMHVLDGQLGVARLVATGYLLEYPDDAEMHYDLACVESRAGRRDHARQSLTRAVGLGLDLVGKLGENPDLVGLLPPAPPATVVAEIPTAKGQG